MQTIYNRRSFLKSSTLAGSGLILGFNLFNACTSPTNPKAAIITKKELFPEDWSDINAFIKIATDGTITIMSPNPEIGQGVKTSMPMIVAEELDADWFKVLIEQAPLNTDWYERQVAGGSQSIRQGWESLRKAGATARQMLVETAAKQWEVPASECTTENGTVHHTSSNKSIGYGELAATASVMEAPTDATLKDPKDFKIIGHSHPNVDNAAIVTGKPLFGIDVQREGMLYAMAVRPPFGKKLKSVDDTAAKAIEGVKEVITFGDKVAVVGNSTWNVKKGRDALVVEWENAEGLESSESQDAAMLALLKESAKEPKRKDGNVDKAFKEAAKVVEAIYECPLLPHNTLEPMNYFAHVREDGVELLGPNQVPSWARGDVAKMLEIDESKITVNMTRMGGGFGRRLYPDFVKEAAEISSLAKAPIKLQWTREDDMSAGMYRPACKYLFRAALDENGNMTAYHIRGAGINMDNTVRENNFPAASVPNYLAETHNLESNVTTAAWRAPVANFLAAAEQSFIDEVALAAEKDPVAFRLQLFDKAINEPVGEVGYDVQRFKKTVELAAEKSNWNNSANDVFLGMSAYYSHNSYVAEVAEVVMIDGSPKLEKVYCAVDCGIVVNPTGAENQVEGGIIDGIGHAMYGKLTIKEGEAQQTNFNNYRLIRMGEAPKVEMFFVDNGESPTGLGEPTLPPAAGALANAVFKATGKRMRTQPFVDLELLG
ncbi:MAG: xanthine dehydrogenase family protein molybdopterin-binding subunit [Chitinophagales bacterium]